MLRYHSVYGDAKGSPDYVSASISMPVKLFDQQVSRLYRSYKCMTLEEVVDHVARRRPLPPRAVVLTFDDGYLDNYVHALPVLSKYLVPATIYLVSETLTRAKALWTSVLRFAFMNTRLRRVRLTDGNGDIREYSLDDAQQRSNAVREFTNILNRLSAPRREARLDEITNTLRIMDIPDATRWFLSKANILEMMRNGITFGAHTVSHPNLPSLDFQEAHAEIAECKAQLEALLGERIQHFSYPNSGGLYPHFSDVVADQVRQAGFHSAVTSVEGVVTDETDLFRIRRIGVNRARSSPPEFSLCLEASRLFT